MIKILSMILSFVFIFSNTNMNFNLNKIITTAINNKHQDNKIVIKTNGSFVSSGTVFGDSIYFGSADGNVYKYNSEEIKFFYNKYKSKITFNNDWFISGTNNFYHLKDINFENKNIESYNHICF